MGIPKFFSWLSSRFPQCIRLITPDNLVAVDNLYLDLNGVLHTAREKTSNELDLMVSALKHVELLVDIVRPSKYLVLALDGVAPRAKMNQQRARRFLSLAKSQRKRQIGETSMPLVGSTALSPEMSGYSSSSTPTAESPEDIMPSVTDSVAITPGTPFMQRVCEHFHFFIRHKLVTDSVWRHPSIIFMGPDVPGEGEHKLLEFMRKRRRENIHNDYSPTERHTLYGLDADLIMLALASNETNFTIFREFTGRRPQSTSTSNGPLFQLFDITLLRECIDRAFQPLTSALPFAYSLNGIIDDFVLLMFMVGNDFLPPLPTLDIGEGALNYFFTLYRDILPALGGYIVTHAESEGSSVNMMRLGKFLEKLGMLENEVLQKRLAAHEAEYVNKARQIRRRMWLKMSTTATTTTPSPQAAAASVLEAPSNVIDVQSGAVELIDNDHEPPALPINNTNTTDAASREVDESQEDDADVTTQGGPPEDPTWRAYVPLNTLIDFQQSECLNANADSLNLETLLTFGTADQLAAAATADSDQPIAIPGELASDADEQILLKLAFREKIKLHSIALFAPSNEHAPSKLKLFVNKPNMDFDDADSETPIQSISPDLASINVTPCGVPVPPRPRRLLVDLAKFQNVSHLTIFIHKNHGKLDVTKITGLVLFGVPVSGLNISDLKRTPWRRSRRGRGRGHKPAQPTNVRRMGPGEFSEEQRQAFRECAAALEEQQRREDLLFRHSRLVTDAVSTTPAAAPGASRWFRELDYHGWRVSYCRERLNVDPADPISLNSAGRRYIEALVWNLQYYYDGVPSWSWYYPLYYAPLASDLAVTCIAVATSDAHETAQCTFDVGQPVPPYVQLVSVLPPQSFGLLPIAIQRCLSPVHSSPLSDFFPETVEVDTEGKTWPHEWVVKLPFVDVARVFDVLREVESSLSTEERTRNQFGSVWKFAYVHEEESQVAVPAGRISSALQSEWPSTLPTVFEAVRGGNNHTWRVEELPAAFYRPITTAQRGSAGCHAAQ